MLIIIGLHDRQFMPQGHEVHCVSTAGNKSRFTIAVMPQYLIVSLFSKITIVFPNILHIFAKKIVLYYGFRSMTL